MAYPKTSALMSSLLMDAEDLREVLECFADEMADQEPYATVSIEKVRYVAGAVDTIED